MCVPIHRDQIDTRVQWNYSKKYKIQDQVMLESVVWHQVFMETGSVLQKTEFAYRLDALRAINRVYVDGF